MADPAGILLHLKLIAASHELIEALTGKRLPGTYAEQRAEVARRVTAYTKAYNASLIWAKDAAKQLEKIGG